MFCPRFHAEQAVPAVRGDGPGDEGRTDPHGADLLLTQPESLHHHLGAEQPSEHGGHPRGAEPPGTSRAAADRRQGDV